MLRLFDLILALLGLIIGFPVLLIVLVCSFVTIGSPLFFQTRVGRRQEPFTLVKFRTMKPGTITIATHLVDASAITGFGRLLRKTKIDELPQLWNVLIGDMSLVGPRPCLPNQTELIEERRQLGVFEVRPGITGLAQINNIDMSTPTLLSKTDAQMLKTLSVRTYFTYIVLTALGKGAGDRVNHLRK